ncbi:efflux ABC transporter, permease protein [Fulvivirga imtechensis AK7]|uniref:Efflux ABC transporter, permease protein n=1 Tax=Fulvivirga imtechensis AK7 TaxID=1237149 RepID=L8JWQ3_9BACT|nr:FtsX-like permease family protein [Fulvivirga imtechensis]ELR73205.1 efflux ABC transporter, permease protein [Fulvivirga imtechensis AK7]
MEYIIKIKKEKRNLLKDKWVWKMAYRDARKNFARLFLFISSVIIGIAAVVSINSFNANLQRSIDEQAKDLLGADLIVNANNPFEEELLAAFDSIQSQEQAEEANLASMAMFMTSTPGTRLIRIVALRGGFPFYGGIETSPGDAYNIMKSAPFVMVDENLASQYDVSSEDSVQLGGMVFQIAGEVSKIPGGGGIQSTFTPSVYISLDYLDSTNLVQYGSRVNYKRYFKFETEEQTEAAIEILKPIIRKYGHSYETVDGRKENLGEGFRNLYRFFNLLAFIALILGCIGVASSVHIYVREKRETVAVLRCIGASGWQSFNIFFIQTAFLGLLGSALGVSLGLAIQYLLPQLLSEFIPLNLNLQISWSAVIEGLILGVVISLLFSVLPLVSVRFVPPLTVLRTNFEPLKTVSKVRITVIILILLFPFLFAAYQSDSLIIGASFFAALLIAFTALATVAMLLMKTVRRFFPSGWSFVWRQSLANLFRPNNQTVVLVVVIGLGAFLMATLNIVQNSLLNQVEFIGEENQSNTILFDIQPGQKEGVVELTKENELPVQQLVPIITCRISSINGKSVSEIQNDTTDAIPNWAITREYRVTYRDSLHSAETLERGTLQHISNDSVYVTISAGMHENLQVDIGDTVVFDIQGVPVRTYISGVRDVEWPKDPPNFIFVFPQGVLEQAPQIFVLTTRIEGQSQANNYQRELVTLFPNVSLIDLRLVLSTIDEFFDKVSFVIQFMALFSIVTGLVVLAGAVMNSKYLRLKENVLLRTIGAMKKQIWGMTILEYGYLGFFAGLTGIGLSVLSGWALAVFFFEIIFLPDFVSLILIWLGIILLTIFVGWLNTRDVINRSPLEVLRKEG